VTPGPERRLAQPTRHGPDRRIRCAVPGQRHRQFDAPGSAGRRASTADLVRSSGHCQRHWSEPDAAAPEHIAPGPAPAHPNV